MGVLERGPHFFLNRALLRLKPALHMTCVPFRALLANNIDREMFTLNFMQ